ncbi:MAG TPA: NAD(P)/FAD-dependent oxidoreductase, partial [Spirochaetota bacterium]|nr:NAD(P)/FAD-dependent oxidoreductase [Spirochaetota bacterium]
MFVKIENIKLLPEVDESSLPQILKSRYGISATNIKILKKSLDARKKDNIFWSYNIAFELPDDEAAVILQYYKEASPYIEEKEFIPLKIKRPSTVLIVGTGPAGLFCGLRLAMSGFKVLFFERGKELNERIKDIETLEEEAKLNPESNVLFGEGGA